MIDTLVQDLRYGVRACLRAPGFTLLAIVTVGVGVGANAAIFSVVNATLLRPLPYPRATDLVLLTDANRVTRQSNGDASPANFLDWRERHRSFQDMAAFRQATFTLAAADHPERVAGAIVSSSFFDVLDVGPALGRRFGPADAQPGAPRVAILADGLWRQQFGARPDVVGETARFNDEPHTIVGVMPPGIDYPDRSAVWVTAHWRVPDDPLVPGVDPSPQRTHGYFSVLARLDAGRTVASAQRDMDAVAAAIEHEHPVENRDQGVLVTPLRSDLVVDVKSTVLLLSAAVGLVLLIASANVSGLLLARGNARRQELAVRAALGAGRARIFAQLLTESVVLSIAGGAAGLLLTMWLIGPLVRLSPANFAVAGAVSVDWRVLVFGLAVSGGAGILFGLVPTHQLARADLAADLKRGARGVTAGQRRARGMLVIGEIALSLVLLVSAGLAVRSFVRLVHQPAGFDPEHVLTVSVSLPVARYPTPARKAAFWEQTIASLRSVPGAGIVGATSRLPLLPGNSTRGIAIRESPGAQLSAHYRTASPDYFRAMGIGVLRGRTFTDGDREDRPLVAVVNETAARRFWPGRDAVGERFSIDEPEITVVGVVADVRSASLDAPAQPMVYVPYRQDPWPFMTLALRTPVDPATLAPAVRDAIWRVDKEQPVGAVLTMDQQMANSLSQRRFSTTLLTAFGAIAAALAAVGLYGVLAFIVSQRRREIGVRIALGATRRDVIGEILGEGLRLTAIGTAIGVALSLAATRLMSTVLFGIGATDVATFAGAAALLALVATAASLVPALRASRVDPLVALRDE
ncbi:MAG TPA: ABC transporter permease [Vicinamibacterales bacterium]|nr:ABC transporter permease [Vicinamibacterales bacterium]